jgi:23S rRNA (cytidine1920-2'-O)/16S rRNA (cytidine1409-2'-O)-methyltransferase
VGKGEVGKGGVVKDPEKQRRVIESLKAFSQGLGLRPMGVFESPIRGAKGNREFWLYLNL